MMIGDGSREGHIWTCPGCNETTVYRNAPALRAAQRKHRCEVKR